MSDAEGMRTVIVIAHDPAQAAHILLHYVSDKLLLLVCLHPKLGLHTMHKLSLGLHLCLGVIDSSGDLTGPCWQQELTSFVGFRQKLG